jgi:hypothetical protein
LGKESVVYVELKTSKMHKKTGLMNNVKVIPRKRQYHKNRHAFLLVSVHEKKIYLTLRHIDKKNMTSLNNLLLNIFNYAGILSLFLLKKITNVALGKRE